MSRTWAHPDHEQLVERIYEIKEMCQRSPSKVSPRHLVPVLDQAWQELRAISTALGELRADIEQIMVGAEKALGRSRKR